MIDYDGDIHFLLREDAAELKMPNESGKNHDGRHPGTAVITNQPLAATCKMTMAGSGCYRILLVWWQRKVNAVYSMCFTLLFTVLLHSLSFNLNSNFLQRKLVSFAYVPIQYPSKFMPNVENAIPAAEISCPNKQIVQFRLPSRFVSSKPDNFSRYLRQ